MTTMQPALLVADSEVAHAADGPPAVTLNLQPESQKALPGSTGNAQIREQGLKMAQRFSTQPPQAVAIERLCNTPFP